MRFPSLPQRKRLRCEGMDRHHLGRDRPSQSFQVLDAGMAGGVGMDQRGYCAAASSAMSASNLLDK